MRGSLLFVVFALTAPFALNAQGTVTLQLIDYAAVPQSGELVNSPDNAVYVARVNFLREEPGGGPNRFFVCDLNGRLYLLDKTTRQFTTYLDFHRNTAEAAGATGLFGAFTRAAGYANGLVTFQFDPDYRNGGSPHFGKFYTVHIEVDTNDGDPRRLPNASGHPGFSNAATYSATTAHEAPGTDNANTRHAVLIEWQDTNPANPTFEGSARELMRIEFNGRIHPMGDLLFNPLATDASHPDWRMFYIAVGDGGAGEQNNPVLHPTPQQLDVLQGKILRISPDDPDGAGPLRYDIPNDNPFTGPAVTVPAGTRPEIWAYGFRNPHRITWDPLSNALIASDIGFHSWEEVNVVRRGGNNGWGDREGTFFFDVGSGLANRGAPPVTVTDPPPPNYLNPVIQYPHSPALGYGDAIAGGFVYRGTRLTELRGKFVFGDITTGELFYADLVEMLSAADRNATLPVADRNASTPVAFHSLKLEWDNPRTPITVLERYDRMHEIVAGEYHARGGRDADLPGSAKVSDLTGGGRADIRLAMDHAGELYILSKSDGMIRAVVGVARPVTAPVITQQPQSQTIALGSTAVLSVEASNAAPAGSGARGLSNVSARTQVAPGENTLIAGFVIGGTTARTVLIRAAGPILGTFGVTGTLADPKLTLFSGATPIAESDNWQTSAELVNVFGERGAFPFVARSRDAVLLLTLPPGAYTAQVSGVGANASGVALVEVYWLP
ncbi:MAG: PQQ-dependent sugar dehydrogenase [Verrucomicrobia bacterium]|nr:PQQ-dependent sugar dehydrogenase [Verrucomicrobiota bacterium]